jgi:hypothetical protein
MDIKKYYIEKKLKLLKNIGSVENLIYDLYFQREFLGKTKHTPFSHLGSTDSASSTYANLKKIFKYVEIYPNDVLVDVGCAKGRVINFWLSKGLKNKIIGIELDKEIAERTKNNLKRFSNVEIITGNILVNLPSEGDIFYLFNPFDREVMKSFIDKVLCTFSNKRITIVYSHCKYLDLYRGNDRFCIDKEFVLNYYIYSHNVAIIKYNSN